MLCRYGPKESRFEKSSAQHTLRNRGTAPRHLPRRTCRAASPHPYRVVSYRTAL